jgi:glycosyltransferase involved in cell wall biosynthesis
MRAMSQKPLRALLIAEACNPQWVSVPLVGWSHSQAIARACDAHIVTQIRNREALLAAGLVEGREFTAIDSEAIAGPAYKIAHLLRSGKGVGWTTTTALNAITYPYFERLLWQKFEQPLRDGAFDVVHRITPLSPTIPSPLAARCHAIKVPFVLGPLNGGVPWPAGFDSARRREKEWLSYVRNAHKFLPGYWPTRRFASAILIASRDTWLQMPHSFHEKCFYLPENAIDPDRFPARPRRIPQKPIRAIFIGRLVPYKGADMVLEAAMPLLKSGVLTLDILGDGPQLQEIRQTIKRENLGNAVRIPGWVAHEQVRNYLAEADIFAFPAVREFGGGVVLEAMAMGVTPIVMNYGGPGELVTDQTGYLIPMSPREQIVSHLRQLLSALSADPRPLELLGPAAQRRALQHFTWNAKARSVIELYRWLTNPASPKPNWPMPIPD